MDGATEPSARSARAAMAWTFVVLAAFLALRVTVPSDLWDQTQPRTIAYTSDMAIRGGEAWILARDGDGLAATKPPLFNWLAVPGVAWFGSHLEWTHKFPSLLALAVTVWATVRTGERLRPGLGWTAATMLVACPGMWKLAYLARPDMVLTACLTVAWATATATLATPRSEREHIAPAGAIAFWAASILAAWTKGPPAAFAPIFAVMASLVLHRSVEPLRRLAFVPGCFAFLALAPAWLVAAWRLDPEHAFRTLWLEEVAARAFGGKDGDEAIPKPGLLGTAVDSPFFFVTRFAPWSIVAILGTLALLDRRDDPDAPRRPRWRRIEGGAALVAAALFAGVVIAAFMLSRGKRADYLLPAFPAAAIVAAWWALSDRFSPFRRYPASIGLVALAVTIANDAFDRRGRDLPPEATRTFERIVAEAARSRAAEPELPVIAVAQHLPHLVAMAATVSPHESTAETATRLLAEGRRIRVLSGRDPFGDDFEATLDALVAAGQARELWSIDLPKIAVRRRYPVRVRLVEIDPADASQAAER